MSLGQRCAVFLLIILKIFHTSLICLRSLSWKVKELLNKRGDREGEGGLLDGRTY